MKRQTLAIVFPFVALMAVGCGQTPASIQVTPLTGPLSSAGETQPLVARVLDAKGEEILKPAITWVSSAPDVAEVDATGTVKALKSGETIVSVTAAQIKEEVPVKVAIYSAIKASEAAVTIAVMEKKQITAQLFDENNNPVEGFVEWKTDNEGVAKINAEGMVEGIAVGIATLTGSTKTQSTTVAVTVAAPAPASLKATVEMVEVAKGATAKLEVQGLDAAGAVMPGIALTWDTSDATKATVDPEGTVTAVDAGVATITAKDASGKSAVVTVTVK